MAKKCDCCAKDIEEYAYLRTVNKCKYATCKHCLKQLFILSYSNIPEKLLPAISWGKDIINNDTINKNNRKRFLKLLKKAKRNLIKYKLLNLLY